MANHNRRLAELSNHHQQLLNALQEALWANGEIINGGELEVLGDFAGEKSLERFLQHFPSLGYVHEVLTELEIFVAEQIQAAQVPELEAGEFWSLGTLQFGGERRPIHVGFVAPVLSIPIRFPMSDKLIAFLITIEGDRDLLKREHHDHFGWHYHYLNFKKKRSNVILCFDRYATPGQKQPRPLFWEGHAEGRYDFRGRPDLWGDTKRQSMHEACAPDLERWPMNTFKNASQEALEVWPRGVTLTPRPLG